MMKIVPNLFLLGLLALPVSMHADEVEAIRNVFTTFQSSLLAGDTVKAADTLAPSVTTYYDKLKPLAASNSTLPATTPPVDRLVVEVLRQRAGPQASKQSLAEMTAEGLRQGWIKLDGLQDVQIGAVSVTGNTATAGLIIKQEPTSWGIPFLKTAAGWKMDPLAFYKMGDFLLKAETARNGFDEQKTIHDIVASLPAKKKI
ncbi:MAG: hypothetical protein B9S32_01860 [Verrucomicrobia bacterium Tous-C9LFEB]|nr:MAG: hypothetical protein B9S32_01860 [Verrucomicrobia bacterium Tous-C9LFEB]